MKLFKNIYGLKQVILLLVGVILIAIFFEASQQLYYINKYDIAEGVTFMDVLQNQAYRWLVWLLISTIIFWYISKHNFDSPVSLVHVLRFVALIVLLVVLNIVIISISQVFINNDTLTLNKLLTDYLPFYTFQKAPVYTLGYIAITIISYLYFANEKLQIEVQQLSDLKAYNLKLYEELKQKNDDKSSILKEVEDTSITKCYMQCWIENQQCKAVGFLLTEINKNRDTLKCYMIGENEEDYVGNLLLDVLVGYTKFSFNFWWSYINDVPGKGI